MNSMEGAINEGERRGHCQKQVVIVMTADNPIVEARVTGEVLV